MEPTDSQLPIIPFLGRNRHAASRIEASCDDRSVDVVLLVPRYEIVSVFEVEEEFLIVKHISVALRPGLESQCYVLLNVISPNPNGYLLI